jgi:hypothetical protein
MRFLLLFHLTLGICAAALTYFLSGQKEALSLSFGALVALMNLSVLVLTWPRLLAKKLVALSVGVIVFKFAILAWILYEVSTGNLNQLAPRLEWFVVGLSLVVVSVVATALHESRQSSKETRSTDSEEKVG